MLSLYLVFLLAVSGAPTLSIVGFILLVLALSPDGEDV